jgi:hypothetical protein
MNAHLDTSNRDLHSYACDACDRRFVVAGELRNDATLRCVCGASLHRDALPRGIYEAAPCAMEMAQKKPEERTAEPSRSARTGESEEADLGYGKSHGYGPSHGGPSGPGDAPAGETDSDVGSK